VEIISIQEVTRENWRATLELQVHPEQQRFVADYTPIAAIALAKAFVRPGELIWIPYAIYADTHMVGFLELAYEPGRSDQFWLYHFFIDSAHQGKGYGKRALQAWIEVVKTRFPQCERIQLTVHPENGRAQALYLAVGFGPTGQLMRDEPVYALTLW
jgi:diamine N-acetyltransferase